MTGTRWTREIRAPRSAVFSALLDRAAVQQWMVPDTEIVQLFRVRGRRPPDAGQMKITYLLADNDLGWTMSLDKLTHLVEANQTP